MIEKIISRRNAIIFVTLLTLWRLYLSASLQLHPDEAYYWLWSRHPDISYFDHSPMVAYFIWFTTLFSKSELWVRLSGTITTLLISVLVWQLAMRMFASALVAAASVMLFNAYPLSTLGMIVMTPDVPLFLFWSLSVSIFWQLVQSGRAGWWYLLGVSFGLALLSKYTAVLLLPSVFVFLVLTEERRWLRTVHPYLALLLGLLCFVPVVYWNSQHAWISFAFQFNHGLGGQHYSLDHLFEYLGGQLLIAGPLVLLLGAYACISSLRRGDKGLLFLTIFSLPIIVFFGFTSLKKMAEPNWTIFAYFAFSVLVSKCFLDNASRVKQALWGAALLLSLVVSATITLQARFSLIPLAGFSEKLAIADATNSFYGWRELGQELQKIPGMQFVVTPSHQLSSEVAYYTNEKLLIQVDERARASQFSVWRSPDELAGKYGAYVQMNEEGVGASSKYIPVNTVTDSFSVMRTGIAIRQYHIIAGKSAPGD